MRVDEEISAYFVPKKLPLTERDHNVAQAPSHSKSPNDGHEDRTDKVRSLGGAQPTSADEPRKKTNALGSSDHQVPPQHRLHSSTQFTWSDSIPEPSVHIRDRHHRDAIRVGELKIAPVLQALAAVRPNVLSTVNRNAPAVELVAPQKQAQDKRPTTRGQEDVIEHQDVCRQQLNDANSPLAQDDQQKPCSNDVPVPSLLAQQVAATYSSENSHHQSDDVPLGGSTIAGAADPGNQFVASNLPNENEQGEVHSEWTELGELLQRCRRSVINVREPQVAYHVQQVRRGPQTVSIEGHWPSQRHENEEGEHASCQIGQSSIRVARDVVQDLTYPLNGFDALSQGQTDPELQSEALAGLDTALWRQWSDLGTDYAGVPTNQSSFGFPDDAQLRVANHAVSQVQEFDTAQTAGDVLLSAPSARGRQGLVDWHEDAQGEEQVPAGFWRPNKLY